MHLRLKVVQGKPRGHCLSFPAGEFMFGRGPECDVRPNSDLVSRQHCLLKVTEEVAMIRDLGSRNGTLVNGKLVTAEQALGHGDTLQVGPLVLEVLLKPEPDVAAETAEVNQADTASEQSDDGADTRDEPIAKEIQALPDPSK